MFIFQSLVKGEEHTTRPLYIFIGKVYDEYLFKFIMDVSDHFSFLKCHSLVYLFLFCKDNNCKEVYPSAVTDILISSFGLLLMAFNRVLNWLPFEVVCLLNILSSEEHLPFFIIPSLGFSNQLLSHYNTPLWQHTKN